MALSVPRSTAQILKLRAKNAFPPDLDELRRLATPGTKLIAVNNPNNSTGSLMDRAFLAEVANIARGSGAWVLCDEVCRGTDQERDGFTASIADLYEKGASTGSMSKTYSLAGLRLGWIAVSRAVSIHRDDSTISVSMLDDHFATVAPESRDKILALSRAITPTNLAILSDWVDAAPRISWVKPKSGTTALLKYDLPILSRDICVRPLEETGVMLTPGSAVDMEGWLRIGYANGEAILREGLARLSRFLRAAA